MSSDMLPSGRTYSILRDGERNPFGQQITVEQPTVVAETESEEARLRRIIGGVKVSGVSEQSGRRRVLLGSIGLGPGDNLPPLIRGQQEQLRVSAIEENRMVLAFVERDPSIEPRVIIVPLGMEPRVNQFLFGEAFEKLANIGVERTGGERDLPMKGVDDFIKGSNDANLQNVTDRKYEMMGEVSDEKADQKTP
jgi:hypothetical protein